ncbi:hypothetical protein HGRIS_010265 [Hohenbuehelia grisea]|uniref:NADP-dependent oxidoreductase domain-containing protein n=1 Tax=Hohenbuehelia grisea TaxID=104357 RepID=A0ABR3J451_9AGAR
MDGHLARPIGSTSVRYKAIAGSPFEKKRRPSDEEIIKRVQELAQKHDVTMSQIALAWSATKVSAPIVGVNSPARVESAVFAPDVLGTDDIAYLEEL